MRPLVSVVIPTHGDRAPRLHAALASLWAQDGIGELFDVEAVVVDDASSGPIEEIVRLFPGTRYIRFETNRGSAAARNAGIAEATGVYVAFLDDDDLWLPHRLAAHVPILEQASDPEIAYSQFIMVHPNGTHALMPGGGSPSGLIFEELFKGGLSHIHTMLVPRAAFEQVGTFDEHISRTDDTDMSLRLGLRFPFRYVEGVLALYLPSRELLEVTSADAQISAWFIRREKLTALLQGTAHEAIAGKLVIPGTWVRVMEVLVAAGRLGEARRTLVRTLGHSSVTKADPWVWWQMKEVGLRLTLPNCSIDSVKSLHSDLKRAAKGTGPRHRLRLRSLMAELWTSVALHFASGRDRDDAAAASAAARALVQNPLMMAARPGLVRVLLRSARLGPRRAGDDRSPT